MRHNRFLVVLSVLLLFSMMRSTSSIAAKYAPVPSNKQVEKVVVIHRHGDRAQIAQGLGTRYPRNEQVTESWLRTLPTESTLKRLILSAAPHPSVVLQNSVLDSADFKAILYCGWDKINYPYAQLTEVGVQEMIDVGRELRCRYIPALLATDSTLESALYCRSTSMCRTGQSLRSLLVGLLNLPPCSPETTISTHALKSLPSIHIRAHEGETMYPRDGASAMLRRRNLVHPVGLAETRFAHYAALETEVKEKLGLPGKVNWEMLMDVLNCHQVHGIAHILQDLPQDTLEKIKEISGWNWGVLYKVSCNRMFFIF